MSSHSGSTESWVGMARAQFHDFMGLLDQFFFTPSVPYTLAAIRIMGGLTVLYINFCFTFFKCRHYACSQQPFHLIQQKPLRNVSINKNNQ